MDKLTPKQKKAYDFIRSHTARKGYAPTLREICTYMGYRAVGSAQDVIQSLRKKGYLTTPGKQIARSLIPTDRGKAQYTARMLDRPDDADFIRIPRLGSIPAGQPIEAIEDDSGVIDISIHLIPRAFQHADKLFALQASGNSMINAGILDGDWLVVHKQEEAPVGSIVVAQFGDNATVKRLMRDQRQVWFLKPENPDFNPIFADDDPFAILGRVVALQRIMPEFN